MAKEGLIAILDFPGHPFQFELSQHLAKVSGHKVSHFYNPKQLGPKSFFKNEKNLKVVQVPKKFSKNNFVRLFDEIIYGVLIVSSLIKYKPKYIISSNMPLIPQFFILCFSKAYNVKFVFWLQDIISIAAKSILKKQNNILSNIVGKFFHFLEFYILKRSNHIITISNDFNDILIDKGIPSHKISCIPNWAPLDDMPIISKNNDFAKKHNLNNTYNILYSGTLGFKHNPDVLLNLSRFLIKKKIDANILIVSEGAAVEYLKEQSAKFNISNISFLPFQDFKIFPQVLATADLSLVMLEDDAGQFSVPSKLLSILCSKRIPICYVPSENLASKIVIDNDCGFHVKNQDDLNNTVEKVFSNKDKYLYKSHNARKYAEQNFNISLISEKVLRILN